MCQQLAVPAAEAERARSYANAEKAAATRRPME